MRLVGGDIENHTFLVLLVCVLNQIVAELSKSMSIESGFNYFLIEKLLIIIFVSFLF